MWVGASALLAIGVKGVEILRRADYQFFELPLGNVPAGKLLQRLQPRREGRPAVVAEAVIGAFEAGAGTPAS